MIEKHIEGIKHALSILRKQEAELLAVENRDLGQQGILERTQSGIKRGEQLLEFHNILTKKASGPSLIDGEK